MNRKDIEYMQQAYEEAKKCQSEDGRISPKVGAIAVKDDRVLGRAHRGVVNPGEHAEYTLLEKYLKDNDEVANATIYTTLEPCTARNHPKICCADRLIERKVARVVIGMLDPNPAITGKGIRKLQQHNIEVTLCSDKELLAKIEDLNREFTRTQSSESEISTMIFSGIDDSAYQEKRERYKKSCKNYKRMTLLGRELFDNEKATDKETEFARNCDSYQLLIANPDSHGKKYRYQHMEPHDPDVQGHNPDQIKLYTGAQLRLAEKIKEEGKTDTKQVKWFDDLALFHIEIIDNVAFVSFYGYKSRAKYSPILSFSKEKNPIQFEYFLEQFNKYWERAKNSLDANYTKPSQAL